ncbi:MAG: NAD(P)/FAD-dependent oxidoreductase [Actinoplanes sp.]
MRRFLMASGALLVGYAVVGALTEPDVNKVGVLIFLVAVLIFHDALFLPLVIGFGALIQRAVPGAWRGSSRAAAIISLSLSVVAAPLVLGVGRSPDNPSVLPRAYGHGLIIVVALVWLAALARRLAVPGDRNRLRGTLAGLIVAAVVAVIELMQNNMTVASAGLTPGPAATAVVTVIGGALIGAVLRYRPGRLLSLMTFGVSVGLLWWAIEWLTVLPWLAGHRVSWSLADAQASFGFLAAGMLQGGLTAALITAVTVDRPASGPATAETAPERPRIVVVGGGFGGVAVAQRLERRLTNGRSSADVVLISDSNYQLFTPMLAGVAGGTLSSQHIGAPLRATLRHTEVRHATVEAINGRQQTVSLRSEAGDTATLSYDQLVLAVGAIPNYRGIPGLRQHAFTLKSLPDAVRLREHLIRQLELAEAQPAATERRRLLSVVVAGGGFAGTELIAELRDLVHAVRRYFPRLDPAEFRFVLIHAGPRILPELDERLAEHAVRRLWQKGIEVRVNVRLSSVDEHAVTPDDETVIPAATVVWTAGNTPNPLVRGLGFDLHHGALACDATMRVHGQARVWAIGDCAAIPDESAPGRFLPPTAQHALREGAALADNIVAVLAGRRPKPLRFRTIALLVALGHQDAAAQIRGRLLSGRLAWMLWRGVYLTKLPGLDKRIRVSVDWLLDMFFPRDVVLPRPVRADRLDDDADDSPAEASAETTR